MRDPIGVILQPKPGNSASHMNASRLPGFSASTDRLVIFRPFMVHSTDLESGGLAVTCQQSPGNLSREYGGWREETMLNFNPLME